MTAAVPRSPAAPAAGSLPSPGAPNAPGAIPGGVVALAAPARRAWTWLAGLAYAEPGTILVGPTGETLRVREDGGLDAVVQGGRPHGGIAGDPCATRGAI